jgi:hypothetical protein
MCRATTPWLRGARLPPRAGRSLVASRAAAAPLLTRRLASFVTRRVRHGVWTYCGGGLRNEAECWIFSELAQNEHHFSCFTGLKLAHDIPGGLGSFRRKRTRPNWASRLSSELASTIYSGASLIWSRKEIVTCLSSTESQRIFMIFRRRTWSFNLSMDVGLVVYGWCVWEVCVRRVGVYAHEQILPLYTKIRALK